jgi:glycosyltransferase involved in cell wall biosynthesis
MKKVIIISYSFPPCNLTAAQRVMSWFEYFNEYGIYPIIITRNWGIPVEKPSDAYKATGKQTEHIKTDKGEIYYLPYKGNIASRLSSSNNNSLVFLRKAMTLMELILRPYFLFAVPFKNIFHFAQKIVSEQKDIEYAIITANPFILFKLGYLLNKRTGIRWIADYRDDWTTDELENKKSLIEKLLRKHDRYFEKKWVSSAHCYITISEYYRNKIATIIPRPGHVIYNGYNKNDVPVIQPLPYTDKFTIIYNGTLYDTQKIETFLNAYEQIRQTEKYKDKIQLKFIGLGYKKDQTTRIRNFFNGNLDGIEITNRISKAEILNIQSKCHLFLMIGHRHIKGIASSKIYEYLSLKKPILLCHSDGDILETLVRITNKHFICNDSSEVYIILKTLCDKFIAGEHFFESDLTKDFELFSRHAQVKRLADIIKT